MTSTNKNRVSSYLIRQLYTPGSYIKFYLKAVLIPSTMETSVIILTIRHPFFVSHKKKFINDIPNNPQT